MTIQTCPECGGELIYTLNGWHCTTPECADKRIKAWLAELQISAHLRRSRKLVERARQEAEDMAAGYADDLEREDNP